MAKVVAVQRKDGQHVFSEPLEDDAAQAEFEKVLAEIHTARHAPAQAMISVGSRAAVRGDEIAQVTVEDESFGRPGIA